MFKIPARSSSKNSVPRVPAVFIRRDKQRSQKEAARFQPLEKEFFKSRGIRVEHHKRVNLSYSEISRRPVTPPPEDDDYVIPVLSSEDRSVFSKELTSLGNFNSFKERLEFAQVEKKTIDLRKRVMREQRSSQRIRRRSLLKSNDVGDFDCSNYARAVMSSPKSVKLSKPVDRHVVNIERLTRQQKRVAWLKGHQKRFVDALQHPRVTSPQEFREWIEPRSLQGVAFEEGPYILPRPSFEIRTQAGFLSGKVGLDEETKEFLGKTVESLQNRPVQVKHNVFDLPSFGDIGDKILKFVMDNKGLGILLLSVLVTALLFNGVESPVLRSIIVIAEIAFLSTLAVGVAAELMYLQWLLDMCKRPMSFFKTVRDGQLDIKENGEGIQMQDLSRVDRLLHSQASFTDNFDVSKDDFLGMVGAAMSGGLLCMTTKKAISTRDATHFFDGFGRISRVKDGAICAVTFVLEVVKRFMKWLGGEEAISGFKIFEEEFPQFRDTAKRVSDFITKMREDPTYNFENGQMCSTLSGELDMLINSIPNDSKHSAYKMEAYRLVNRLQPLVNCFASENLTGASRKKPTCIWISGDSGVGKSTVLKKLITKVYGRVASDQKWAVYKARPKDFIYAYDYTTDFWDAYHNQPFCIVDEAGLMREVSGATNDGFMALIRMVNIFDFPLNMADLPKKGKTSFTSEFIFLTSNRESIKDIKSLYYPEAYTNRCQLSYHQCVRPEFATETTKDLRAWSRKVDVSKIPYDAQRKVLNFDWIEHIPIDLRTGLATGPSLDLEGTAEQIVDMHYKNEAFSQIVQDSYVADVQEADEERKKRLKRTTDSGLLATGEYEMDYDKWIEESGGQPVKSLKSQYRELQAEVEFEKDKARAYRDHKEKCAVCFGRGFHVVSGNKKDCKECEASGFEKKPPFVPDLDKLDDLEKRMDALQKLISVFKVPAERVYTKAEMEMPELDTPAESPPLIEDSGSQESKSSDDEIPDDLRLDIQNAIMSGSVNSFDSQATFVTDDDVAFYDPEETVVDDRWDFLGQSSESDDAQSVVRPQGFFGSIFGSCEKKVRSKISGVVNTEIGNHLVNAGVKLLRGSMNEMYDIESDPFDCGADDVANIMEIKKLPMWFLLGTARAFNLSNDVFIDWARNTERKFDSDKPQASQLEQFFLDDCVRPEGVSFSDQFSSWYERLTSKTWLKPLSQFIAIASTIVLGMMLLGVGKSEVKQQVRVDNFIDIHVPIDSFNEDIRVMSEPDSPKDDTMTKKKEEEDPNPAWNKIEPQSGKTAGRRSNNKKASDRLRPVKTQGFKFDNNTQDKAFSVLLDNQYAISHVNNPNKIGGYITFFVGNQAFMPSHFYDILMTHVEADPKCTVTLFPTNGATPITRTVDSFFGTPHVDRCDARLSCNVDGDYVFMTLSSMRPHKNIIDHFISDNDSLMATTFNALAMKWSYKQKVDGNFYVTKPALMAPIGGFDTPDGIKDPVSGLEGTYHNDRAFSVQLPTREGDCGVLYWSADDTKVNSKIVGMHVAGDNNCGYACAITKEMLKEAIRDCPLKDLVTEETPSYVDLNKDVKGPLANQGNLGSQFRMLGSTKPLYNSAKNNVVPSVLHNKWWTSNYEPARVESKVIDGVFYDPMELHRNKICVNKDYLGESVYHACANSYFSKLFSQSGPPRLGFGRLGFVAAISGIEGVMQGIPLGTSPGFPLTEGNKGTGKRYWFEGEDGGYDLEKPQAKEVLKTLEDNHRRMIAGERLLHVFKDSPKVERRKKGKKCRQVNACPMLYFIHCRDMFGSFVDWMMENVLRNGSAMGINPHGEQWDVLARTMARFKYAMAGDYSAWDGSLTPEMMEVICMLIRRFYASASKEDNIVREILLLDLLYSRHIVTICTPDVPVPCGIDVTSMEWIDLRVPEGYTVEQYINGGRLKPGRYRLTSIDDSEIFLVTIIYEWRGAMPSGHFLTTIGNIIVNNCVLRYAFVDQVLKAKYFNNGCIDWRVGMNLYLDFIECNCFIVCFGDDNLVGLSDALAMYVTERGTSVSMASIGLIYTDENKVGAGEARRTFTQVSFLKRSFRYEPTLGRYVAPLELEVCYEMLYWDKLRPQPGAFKSTVRTSNCEVSYHGKDVWWVYWEMVSKELQAHNLTPPEATWEAAITKAVTLDVMHL